MNVFNVIIYDPNRKLFEPYNVLPYFIKQYKKLKRKLKTFEEFKNFVISESQYRFWSRCEYEIILSDWPNECYSEKWDIYRQITMNIDIITKLIMKEISNEH